MTTALRSPQICSQPAGDRRASGVSWNPRPGEDPCPSSVKPEKLTLRSLFVLFGSSIDWMCRPHWGGQSALLRWQILPVYEAPRGPDKSRPLPGLPPQPRHATGHLQPGLGSSQHWSHRLKSLSTRIRNRALEVRLDYFMRLVPFSPYQPSSSQAGPEDSKSWS